MTFYEEIIEKLRGLLVGELEPTMIQQVESAVILALGDYDITPKERSLIVYERTDAEIVNRFFLAKAVQGCTKHTLELYKTNLQRAFSAMNKHIKDITPDDIRVYLARKKMNKASSNYLANMQRTLSSFFTWAAAEEWVDKNPMLRVEKVKVRTKPEAALTDEQMEQVRFACRTPRERALVEMLYSTGCRISEVCALNISDIDFENDECQVLGKGEKYRTVYISQRAKYLLLDYLKTRKDNNVALFITDFSGIKGEGMRSYLTERYEAKRIDKNVAGKILQRIGKNVGFRLHPHLLRKTVATQALSKGMPIEEVRVMLGHNSISTTTIYAQTQQEAVKQSHRKYV